MKKCNYCFFVSLLFILFVACGKKDKIVDTPPAPAPSIPATWEWFKLTGVERVSLLPNSYTIGLRDSIEIDLNSAKNEIVLRKNTFTRNGAGYDKNTSVDTYTYNSKHQLVLYEHTDPYYDFSITAWSLFVTPMGTLKKYYPDIRMAWWPAAKA